MSSNFGGSVMAPSSASDLSTRSLKDNHTELYSCMSNELIDNDSNTSHIPPGLSSLGSMGDGPINNTECTMPELSQVWTNDPETARAVEESEREVEAEEKRKWGEKWAAAWWKEKLNLRKLARNAEQEKAKEEDGGATPGPAGDSDGAISAVSAENMVAISVDGGSHEQDGAVTRGSSTNDPPSLKAPPSHSRGSTQSVTEHSLDDLISQSLAAHGSRDDLVNPLAPARIAPVGHPGDWEWKVPSTGHPSRQGSVDGGKTITDAEIREHLDWQRLHEMASRGDDWPPERVAVALGLAPYPEAGDDAVPMPDHLGHRGRVLTEDEVGEERK